MPRLRLISIIGGIIIYITVVDTRRLTKIYQPDSARESKHKFIIGIQLKTLTKISQIFRNNPKPKPQIPLKIF